MRKELLLGRHQYPGEHFSLRMVLAMDPPPLAETEASAEAESRQPRCSRPSRRRPEGVGGVLCASCNTRLMRRRCLTSG